MHNVHFILITADSAKEAASEAEQRILNWGDENNWRSIGGVASEDGSDDIENYADAGWPLSFLDEETDAPKAGTYFSRAMAYVRATIMEGHSHLPATLLEINDRLRSFDPNTGDSFTLWSVGRNLQKLSELVISRAAIEIGAKIPELREWQFDQFGLTDMTGGTDGVRRYLVFFDMHA